MLKIIMRRDILLIFSWNHCTFLCERWLFLFILKFQNAISLIIVRNVNRCWFEILTFILRGFRISFTISKLFPVLTLIKPARIFNCPKGKPLRVLPTCIISNLSDRFRLKISKGIIPFPSKIKMHIFDNQDVDFPPIFF